MKLGIVGLPNVGKSTLFNAITKAGAESANYPFCTIEPNVGVVSVPDSRLDELAKMYNPEKITEWINDETAKCAFCGVDAVIPESYDYEFSDSLLLAMKEYWF